MRYSKEEKAKLLEEWRQSGKSIQAYVKERGLVRWTFHKWLKAEKESGHRIVEVSAVLEQPAPYASWIIIEKEGVTIRVPVAASGGALHAVMEMLGVAS